jgi:hypothetical protein
MKAMEQWADGVSKPLAILAHPAAQVMAVHGESIARVVNKPNIACRRSPYAYHRVAPQRCVIGRRASCLV